MALKISRKPLQISDLFSEVLYSEVAEKEYSKSINVIQKRKKNQSSTNYICIITEMETEYNYYSIIVPPSCRVTVLFSPAVNDYLIRITF